MEAVPPDVGEQALAADHLAHVQEQVVQEPELAVGEVADQAGAAGLPAGEVERQAPAAEASPSSSGASALRSCTRTRASSSSSEKGFGT